MINHIDVSSVLRRTVSDLYSNLVTRSTGAAVRMGIEEQLAASPQRAITVLDFSHVGLLDLSCADEIVAKLLLRNRHEPPARNDAVFYFSGVSEAHLDAIEAVLERHGLALVADLAGVGAQLIGAVDDRARGAWNVLRRFGRASARDVALRLDCEVTEAESLLEGLARRGLLMRLGTDYVAVGGTA